MAATRRYWRLRLVLFVLAALLALRWGGGMLADVLTPLWVRTVEARRGTLVQAVEAPAVAIRAERLLAAPQDGAVTFLVAEGQRVREGEIVAEVGAGDRRTGDSAERVQELDGRLRSLDEEAVRVRAGFAEEIDRLEVALEGLEAEARRARAAGDFAGASGYEDEAEGLRQQIDRVEAAREVWEDELERGRDALVEERQALARTAGGPSTVVRAPAPGLVAFTIDGLEGVLRPEGNLVTMADQKPTTPRRLADGFHVESGDPVLRLVDNYTFHVLVTLPPGVFVGVGDRVRIGVKEPGGRMYSARATRTAIAGDHAYALLALDVYDPLFTHLRHFTARVELAQEDGVIIPSRAVVEGPEGTGVYLWTAEGTVYRAVAVLATDGGESVVLDVPEGASVVVNPGWLVSRK